MNSDLKISFLRKIILKSAIQIEYLFYGIKKTDAHNGLRVFNKKSALCLDLSENRMAHSSIIIQSIVFNKLKFKEFPVKINYNIANRKHKQKNINSIIIFSKILQKKIEYLFKKSN